MHALQMTRGTGGKTLTAVQQREVVRHHHVALLPLMGIIVTRIVQVLLQSVMELFLLLFRHTVIFQRMLVEEFFPSVGGSL